MMITKSFGNNLPQESYATGIIILEETVWLQPQLAVVLRWGQIPHAMQKFQSGL